jgi:hypothetical protein
MRAHHAQINLDRVTSGNVRAMVAQVAAKIALSHETIATAVERTGGVPLFVEELTRAAIERCFPGWCFARPHLKEIIRSGLSAKTSRSGQVPGARRRKSRGLILTTSPGRFMDPLFHDRRSMGKILIE